MSRIKASRMLAVITLTVFMFNQVCLAYTPEVVSNKYTSYRPKVQKINPINTLNNQDEKVAENKYLALYLDNQDLSIKVFDKSSGYVYSSNDVNTDNINEYWQNYANSPVTIKALDKDLDTVQESFWDNKKSKSNVTKIKNGFSVKLTFYKTKISLEYSVILEENNIIFKVDDSSIKEEATAKIIKEKQSKVIKKPVEEMSALEKAKAKSKKNINSYDLYSIQLYPFFGAVEASKQDGYTLIPDGSGALIRYDDIHNNINIPYESDFFGIDYGLSNNTKKKNYTVTYKNRLMFPLYGMVHGINQSGYLNIIEKGAEYAKLVSYPAGVKTDFYFTTAEYIYNNVFQQELSASQRISSKLDNRKSINIQERLTFVSDEKANYTGLGNVYKDYLLKNDRLNTYNIKEIPLTITTTMGLLKKRIIGNKTYEITSTEEILNMHKYLLANGVKQTHFNLIGASLDEYTASFNDKSKISSAVEKKYSFKEMNEYLADNNGIAFIKDTLNIAGKANAEKYVLRSSDKQYSVYQKNSGNKQYWLNYLNNIGMLDIFNKNLKKIEGNSFAGFNNRNLVGPYTHFGKNGIESRQDNIDNIVDIGNQLKDSGTIYSADNAYSYMLKNIDISNNTTTKTVLYKFITDTVPFYQIVLSGNIPMSSDSLNYSSNIKEDILRSIEYNVYPEYSLVSADYKEMDMSYSIYYDKWSDMNFKEWKEEVIKTYSEIEKILGKVKNESIISHEVINPQVVAITYSNGKTIIVNYSNKDYNYKGTIVGKKGSVVIG